MISVKTALPKIFSKVRCTHKSDPSTWCASMVYWYDPKDKTFRTKKGNNKTHKIAKWEPIRYNLPAEIRGKSILRTAINCIKIAELKQEKEDLISAYLTYYSKPKEYYRHLNNINNKLSKLT